MHVGYEHQEPLRVLIGINHNITVKWLGEGSCTVRVSTSLSRFTPVLVCAHMELGVGSTVWSVLKCLSNDHRVTWLCHSPYVLHQ